MSGKTIFEAKSPKTQSVEAVKALLSWQGKSAEPLPVAIPLNGSQLTLSSKADVYYMTTARDCSCPVRCFNPGHACKHMKDLVAAKGREASRAQTRAYQARQRELRARAKAAPSLPEEPLIKRCGFKPFSLTPAEERAAGVV